MSTLSNVEIAHEMHAGRLIHAGVIDRVGPACYELRMGTVYYDLTENAKRIDCSSFGNVIIKPHHHVVLITMEEVDIPINMLARVVSKGSLFSIGLGPVSTYADPGFSGDMGIVTQNLSDKYILLPVGEPIAKIEFSRLTSDSTKPYKGQHGYQTKIWPIRTDLQKTHIELSQDPRIETEAAEAYKVLPAATARAIKSLFVRQRVIDAGILLMMIINVWVIVAVTTKMFDIVIAVVTNVISTALVGALMWVIRPAKM